MDARTREVLEFDKVLDLIAGRASSPLGREYVRTLKPLQNVQEVEAQYAPLRDVMALLDRGQRLPVDGLFDATQIFNKGKIEGSMLDEEEWSRLSRFLKTCRRVVAFRENQRKNYEALGKMLNPLESEPDLENAIDHTFDDEGQVRDHASPALASIRRSLRSSEQRLRRTVEKLTADLDKRGVLQENFATVRGGRYAFPVKSNFKGRVGGIFHGKSSSGETVYIEPNEVVEASNEVENFYEEERIEVYRILRALTSQLRPFIPLGENNLEILRHLDGLYALGRTASDKGWHLPIVQNEGALRLFNAQHPLLNLRQGGCVPITMLLEREDLCLVLSGPNAGGKTTAMKTVGLISLLVKCGCPIPAFPDSTITIFHEILADIGDQQDLEEGISTFTGHMQRIKELWRKSGSHSLVIMDELGTGTDPQEGGALAVACLQGFSHRASLTITTSHLNPVKVWAEDTKGVRNASFSLDPETRNPTYKLRLDLPGASEALEIAEKEGLPHEIIEHAKQLVGDRHLEMGELLRRIEDREQRLTTALRDADARAKSLEEQDKLMRVRSDLLRDERREFREDTLKNKEKAVSETRVQLERLIANLPSEENLALRKEALVRSREEILRLQHLNATERRRLAEQQVKSGEVTVGQHVYIKGFGQWGQITEINTGNRKASVQVGLMKVYTTLDELLDHDPGERRIEQRTLAETAEQTLKRKGKKGKKKTLRNREALRDAAVYSGPKKGARYTISSPGGLPERPSSMTLDLHGFRVDEALSELDRYLDRSLLADFPFVKICHGTGTGRLYKAVHEYLRTHPTVKNFRFGNPDEGGGGTTIVEF